MKWLKTKIYVKDDDFVCVCVCLLNDSFFFHKEHSLNTSFPADYFLSSCCFNLSSLVVLPAFRFSLTVAVVTAVLEQQQHQHKKVVCEIYTSIRYICIISSRNRSFLYMLSFVCARQPFRVIFPFIFSYYYNHYRKNDDYLAFYIQVNRTTIWFYKCSRNRTAGEIEARPANRSAGPTNQLSRLS